ncbi:hypothetical protein MBLNU459_g1049t1 [Dothideomycetes sp. NU459]
MATETQSRLAVSIPSMLMTYLTGSSNTIIESDSASIHSSDHHSEPSYLTPDQPRNRPRLQHSSSTVLPSPSKSYRSVMFGDAENSSCASGDLSRENSFVGSNARSRKRLSRSKTSYSLCHPPPKSGVSRQKLHVRARPLLQLHKLAVSSRPMPAFELLPSAIFSPSLSRSILKGFRTRHTLCPADLAIVKADKYHQDEENHVEDELRDVLALICKGRKNDAQAKIFLDDGSEWEAHVLPNGSYEFTSTTEHGLSTTVRWVLKRPRVGRSQSASDMELTPTTLPPNKFNFSTISPRSRRHPVIANLSTTTLNIQDFYAMPSSTPSSPPTPRASLAADDIAALEASLPGEPIETTPALRTLITATSIWVTLREGWCPGYKYEDAITRSPSTKLAASPSKSTFDPSIKEDAPRRSASIARMLRSASSLKRRSTGSATGDGSSEDVPEPRVSNGQTVATSRTRPRAESASTVIHRTTWPRPEMRGRRKNTASSTSTNRFGIDVTADMTEEEEEEEDVETKSPMMRISDEHMQSPTPVAAQSTRITEARSVAAPPKSLQASSQKQKRESSAASSNISLEVKPQMKKRKGKGFRILLCGIA